MLKDSTRLGISTNGDGAFPASDRPRIVVGQLTDVARLTKGMQSGASSIMVRIELQPPRGSIVYAETSMKLFLTAADIFNAVEVQDGLAQPAQPLTADFRTWWESVGKHLVVDPESLAHEAWRARDQMANARV